MHTPAKFQNRTAIRCRSLYLNFVDSANAKFARESLGHRMSRYRDRPGFFATDILGSKWWEKQKQIAMALVNNRRVAVKSANGVGKTHLAADIALWFLYAFHPAIVLTTAPTWRQVRHILWQQIRLRFHTARDRLPGQLFTTRLAIADGWYALGLSTDNPEKFQGFHDENLLIIFDEASGIPDEIWDAAEGVAVAENNKILAIGNPLKASGRFYQAFARASGWHKITISALEHPNVTGKGPPIRGCITTETIENRISDWCDPIDLNPPSPKAWERGLGGEGPSAATAGPLSPLSPLSHAPSSEIATPAPPTHQVFTWRGRCYRPNNIFRARVLGQFPTGDEESLIPLAWIEEAMERPRPAELTGFRRAAADVARKGGDETVIGLRIGPVLIKMETYRDADTMQVAGHIRRFAYEEYPEAFAVDAIGIGAGVVDRLAELGLEGLVPINASHKAHDTERYANRRAELYWGLRERLHDGDIVLNRDERLLEELAGIRYLINSRGQVQIEDKDRMRTRMNASPDRADMLAMLFDGPVAPVEDFTLPPSPAALFRQQMQNW